MVNRREFLSTAAVQAAVLKRQPNVVYIHAHDTGRYIQPYGHAVPTPNLQKFAEGGVLFRRAFCGAPTCSPSRAALLTGQSAHGSGMVGLAHRGFRLNDPKRHLASFLQGHGYQTTLCNVQHEAPANAIAGLGYSGILRGADNSGPQTAQKAVEFLNHAPKQPFFLACGFFETHREYPVAGPKEDPRYTQPPSILPDVPTVRQDMANFKASARVMDESMGAVFQALARNGLEENTLVICTTDHGIAFPGMKCSLSDHGIGVMLMMRGPGGFTGGKVADAMVSHLDVFPTICEVLGLSKPGWLEGRSLLPVVRGEQAEIREELFAEVSYHAAYEPKRAVRTQRWKYAKRFDERGKENLPNCDDGLSKSYLVEQGWRERPVVREELYDLTFDPGERRNLAADSAQAPTLDAMRGRLDRWMRATDDPLLKGRVPTPKGAVANDPGGLSPREKPLVLD